MPPPARHDNVPGEKGLDFITELFHWTDNRFQSYKVSRRYRASVWLTAAKMAIAAMATMTIAPPISTQRSLLLMGSRREAVNLD
jgi:hypothetical protein